MKLAGLAVVFVLTLEIAARMDDAISWGAPFFDRYTNETTRGSDDDGIRCNIPNAGFEKWQHNKYGFRGPAYPEEKPSGVYRLVCMGTSETYGGCETTEWPARLQQKLDDIGAFEVINPSVAGLRFKEYEPYLKKRVTPFDPDLVIIIFNPVTYFVNLDRWPNFSPENRKKRKANETTVEDNSGLSLGTILKHSRLLPKAKLVVKRFLPQNLVKEYQLKTAAEKIEQMKSQYLNGSEPRDSIPDNYVDSLYNQLGSLIASIQAEGSDVLLTTYPTLLADSNKQDYPSIFLENQRFYVELTLDGMIDAAEEYEKMLPEICREYGIEYVDLKSRIPQTPEYYCDNVHYYDNAADSVATAIYEYIAQRYKVVAESSLPAAPPQ